MLPREKAIKHGFDSLLDYELIAILLRTGYKNNNVFKLAKDLSDTYGLVKLMSFSYQELVSIKGVSEVKALDLLCVKEISRRLAFDDIYRTNVITNKDDLIKWLQYEVGLLSQEVFIAIYLDVKNRIITYKKLFIGTLDISVVHPREIFKGAVLSSASKIICVHNHPSGDVSPSKSDINITHILKELGEMMGILLIDHLIISNNKSYSCIND